LPDGNGRDLELLDAANSRLKLAVINFHASRSGRHDVGQGNVNIWQHLRQIAYLALAVSFS